MKIKFFIPLLALSLLLTSCFEDMDDNIQPATTIDIQNFIYRGLNYYYLYKADTPELANDVFGNQAELNDFLNNYETPESLFDYLLSSQDRFSNLFSDFRVIEDALNGISLSNGMEYGLVFYPDNSGNVFGYVRYVSPNTDAEAKGLQRGDLFTTVDGQQITDKNFMNLFTPNSYTIGLATSDGTNFLPTGETVALTKAEYNENPVFKVKTIDVNGEKIGYLMYNSFIRNYDIQLNDAFAKFKADGVTNLVVDLRYNGGGAVETATDLASMITGQFNGQVFYKEFWNADRQAANASDGLFDGSISNGAPTNSLNLSNVYILTTRRTASASELVINGLKPYINTVQVGDLTTGKFQASFLLYDAPAPNFSRQQANPSHYYAMLPLVFKTSNAVGNTDYGDGLFPEILLRENYFDLGQLGDENEPLLAAALFKIAGRPILVSKAFNELEEISDSNASSPINGKMIAN
ncbi:periplasmic protease [Aequorivita sublithincola DSM 14238]|uniref:Periplasmic protease n=1 Tax=Aequorivita sublithincola (strain DSM 14238 / LMG 21431 / ACAM 643 / 9-3) TaxID=746697 RepID=I3YZL8_AEQSU|nr:S41 family peptidase [Aequorivita sublithincola]AFL82436.1 periplasmic protease [Aequorivita sublithincola DSM 14238]